MPSSNWLSASDVGKVAPLVHAGGPGKEIGARIMVMPTSHADAARAGPRRWLLPVGMVEDAGGFETLHVVGVVTELGEHFAIVLAEQRGNQIQVKGLFGEAQRIAWNGHLAEYGIEDRACHAARLEVRMTDGVVWGEDGRAGNPFCFKHAEQVRVRPE